MKLILKNESARELKSSVFLLCLLCTISLNLQRTCAQNFERFSNKEGFNQNTINDIEKDKYGFLWYGTPNGLIRYDGYEFKTYTTQSLDSKGLVSNKITHLYNDPNGLLWIGTNNGVNIYVPWIEKFYKLPLPEKFGINHISTNTNGQVFISGSHQLYVCEVIDAENGTFEVSKNLIKGHLENLNINDFSFLDSTTIITATSSGVWKLNLKNKASTVFPVISTTKQFESYKSEPVTRILNLKNVFWIGTQKGIFKVTIHRNRIHEINNFNKNNLEDFGDTSFTVNTILEDKNGMVWIGTRDYGLISYNETTNQFNHFNFEPQNELGLSSNHINALFQDDFNVLWIGTAQGGINKLDLTRKPFFNFSSNPYDKETISDDLITAILEDRKGKLWVSAYNKPLFRSKTAVTEETVDNLKFESLESRIPIFESDKVRCIYEDRKGYLWFGTDSTVVFHNPYNNSFSEVILDRNKLSNSRLVIRSILQIDDRHILLAGHDLVVLENPWEKINVSKRVKVDIKSLLSLGLKRVQVILEEQNNQYWLGTNKGLLKVVFEDGNFKIIEEYNTRNNSQIKLSNNNIFSLNRDNKNNLWVGTFGGGLNKIKIDKDGVPVNVNYFRKNDILPDDAIYGLLPENENYLWISTDMGLVRFHKLDNSVDVFDVRDGLAQNNFRQAAYYKGNSGYYYFGGLNGLTVFKPDNIKLNLQPPQILISSLLINNQQVKIGEEWNNKVILNKSISETDGISISQTQRIISLNVVVEHTSTPAKNKLAYKLEGFNDNWVTVDRGKATITYTNLAAGSYILRFKAANGDGVWSEVTRDLKIEITPPWYQTWWSYLAFIVVALAICVGLMVYFLKLERLQQKLKYEKLDKERIEIVNQGKFRYFTNLSHEFRTPLTLIAGPLEKIVDLNTHSGINNYLIIIKKNTKRLLSLADQLITFRQAEQGRIDLNLVECTLGEFIYPTTEAFENYAIDKNINFFYKVNSPNEDIVVDIEKCERIIFNLLSNAFKNTPPQGTISIELGISFESGEKLIHLDVIDSGKGIPKEHIGSIFERFYQLGNRNGNISGGGIGLAFCKSLINLLGGEISAKSEPGVETRFSVTIPSKPSSFVDKGLSGTNKKSHINDWIPLSSEKLQESESDLNIEKTKKYSILVVENEEDVQNFLISTFSEKYRVRIANNGKEALLEVREKEPDLIVSDVMMPEMDGYELCEKIKSNPETCHLPILLLTALGDNENIIKGLEFGADDYVSKPFSVKHLELRIEKLIQTNIQIKKYFKKNSFLPKNKNLINLNKKDELFLESMSIIIEKNLADSSFGVEELSREFSLSTSTFYRRLKQLTGQVPNVYLRNFRLQRAMELLESNEGYNVAEVMHQIGIESNSYFSTSFKKLHGISPSELLKRNEPIDS